MSPDDSPAAPATRVDRAVAALAAFGARNPVRVLLATFALLALSLLAASRLDFREDFIELLPSQSEGARLLRRALARLGGGSATLFVVVDSPDAEANRRFIDAVEPPLRALPRSLVRTVEHGPEEIRRFYMQRRWLFAGVGDLEEAECELRRARESAVPGFEPLDDEPCSAARSDRAEVEARRSAPGATPEPPPPPNETALAKFRRRVEAQLRDADQFPTGYFRSDDGRLYAIVIRAPSTGTGDATSDRLLRAVRGIVDRANPRTFHPAMQVGFGGDIPNAAAERDALKEEAVKSSGIAILLILVSIVVFFRSGASLPHIGLPMLTGVGMAGALAMAAFGYVNASTAFLGSIIAGNGINYGIVYLARYRERRALGDDLDLALRDAAVTCRSGTQLASLAAAGAYGSLMLTSFRGFSQFGRIGAAGMIFCWCATFVSVPASVALYERLRERVRGPRVTATTPRAPGRVAGAVGRFTDRFAWPILAAGVVLTVLAAVKLPSYLRDPWEYDFSRLGSRGSRRSGADAWSSRADRIFTARGSSPDILLADRFSDVLDLSAALKARDQRMTGGRYVDRVETAWDRLGGAPPVVARKLEILARMREHIDALMPSLNAEDQATAREWRPPESLRAPRPEDLPALVREPFTERDGTFGTPIFVYYKPSFSPSNGRQLMVVANLTRNLRLPDGRTVPTVSRSTVFAEMVQAMGVDGPRATFGAFIAVVLIVILATRRAKPAAAVLGSLLCGVVLTVGGAAWLGVRLKL
ncbi:MAG: MMPL family transporter [Polyangiales bacterium]